MKSAEYFTEKGFYGVRIDYNEKQKQWLGSLQKDPVVPQNNDSDSTPIIKPPISFVGMDEKSVIQQVIHHIEKTDGPVVRKIEHR